MGNVNEDGILIIDEFIKRAAEDVHSSEGKTRHSTELVGAVQALVVGFKGVLDDARPRLAQVADLMDARPDGKPQDKPTVARAAMFVALSMVMAELFADVGFSEKDKVFVPSHQKVIMSAFIKKMMKATDMESMARLHKGEYKVAVSLSDLLEDADENPGITIMEFRGG